MADLYGTSANASSSTLESEEMPWFLQNILRNSSSKPSPSLPFNSDFPIGDGSSKAAVDSSSTVHFSDPGVFFPAEANESVRNSFSSSCAEDCDALTPVKRKFPLEEGVEDFDFGSEEHLASELPPENVLPRSSKRTRAAEIHNLSEKKRRSRINEKLKALQNLVPNSNKTDKASMLDEAIEYLKQLQLQVQMLTMRNGLSLPGYLPQTQQSLQLPQGGVDYGGENVLSTANKRDLFSGNQEISTHTPLYISNQIPRNQPNVIPSATDITNSETLFGLEPTFRIQ